MSDLRERTPFGLVSADAVPEPATKRELLRLSRRLEREALADPPSGIAACLQDSRFLTPPTRDAYARLAAAGCPARLHGRGMQSWLAQGVTGVHLDDDSPLVDEWVIVVPGRVLFAAADLHVAEAPDDEREFQYALTRDPVLIGEAAGLLGL